MIDLSKLKVNEVPQKTIDVEICGEVQNIVVKALDSEGMTALNGVHGMADASAKRAIIFLMYGADMTEPEARLLINGAIDAANQITNEVANMTMDYIATIKAERETAKKN